MVTKTIWISYDLGIGGDYQGLYTWLDNMDATECGDSMACLIFKIPQDNDEILMAEVKNAISENVNIDSKSRIYIVRRVVADGKTKVSGKFIFGKRKGNPWEGYGSKNDINSDDCE